MPIYEYECTACPQVIEVMQKFSDAPLERCPVCSTPVHKIMSRTSFALKGKGWYTTDYKRSAAKKEAAASESAAPCAAAPACPAAVAGACAAPAAPTPAAK